MGKFSQPRNKFQEQPQTTMQPLMQPEAPQEILPTDVPEEEAIERTFREVTGGTPKPNPLAVFFERNKFPVMICLCVGVLAILLIIVGVLAFGRATDPYEGKILDNVSIAGINVGGLTRNQAEDVLRSATEHTFTQQEMVVEIGDDLIRLSPENTGAKLDVKAAVKAAYDYGRTGSQAQKEAAYNTAQSRGHIIALLPYLELDTEYIQRTIRDYAAGFTTTYTGPDWHLEGPMPELTIPQEGEPDPECQTLVITMGTPGIGMDAEKLYEDILDAYSFNRFHVKYQEQDPDMLPALPDLQAIYDACYIAPVDASMDQQTYQPIPGSYGYDFDLAEGWKAVNNAGYGETVTIPMRLITPGVLEESMLFQDVLGYCETPHNTNENRNYNLKLVCQFLNGLILDPGEEFSYNDSVGERTSARGFKPAPAYSGTELVDSVGGGVCQGSSTLYYCALLADMEIVYRINHGFPVSYIPLGLDATVNWGGPDMKFRNTSNYPIQLKAEVSGGMVKMWIMGTDERDYYCKLDYEITGYREPDVVYEEYGPESGYYDGQILQHGTGGYIVRSYRYKYSKATDELISKDFIALSSYMTEDKIIVKLIGGDEEEEPTDPTEPSTEATEPSTEATEPSTGATEPSTEATEPSSEATQPPTEPPTQAPTDPET